MKIHSLFSGHLLDTPEGVAQELVTAGLISGQDLVVGKCFIRFLSPFIETVAVAEVRS